MTISGETAGEGPDVVLLHGLTATRRYVVMGSKALPRAGYRVTTFDARGHGESSPAADRAEYEYRDMVADLEAVLSHLGAERAALGGASMGAHTAMAFALAFPERVSALVQITPAYDGRPRDLTNGTGWRTASRPAASTGSSRPGSSRAKRSGARPRRPSRASDSSATATSARWPTRSTWCPARSRSTGSRTWRP